MTYKDWIESLSTEERQALELARKKDSRAVKNYVDKSQKSDTIELTVESIEKLFTENTPASLKDTLEQGRFEVKPLARGSLKDVDFADGGGYKLNFGNDGLLQYHPASGSHHGGAYYKLSTGKGGIHRYGLDGKEKK